MSSLKKKTITRYRLDGKVVPKGTPGAEKVTEKSAKWYGQLRAADGKQKCVPLSTDKQIARKMLSDLERQADRERAGLTDRYTDHLKTPLTDHLAAYRAHLTGRANTPLHVRTQINRIARIFEGCGFSLMADLDADSILNWLATRREEQTSFGMASTNHYITAIKGFSNWLRKSRRCPDDVLVELSRINASVDKRRDRRILSPEEFASLMEATRNSSRTDQGSDWRFTGTDREILYLTAAFTGLRASELASLNPQSFDLKARTITIQSGYSKNRQEATLPLLPELATRLTEYLTDRPTDQHIWPGTWAEKKRGGQMVKRDLREAGIPFVDAKGKRFDFHALRCQFASNLARAGVHPSIAQKLCRHSTIALTMDVYTQADTDDVTAAINSLSIARF